MDALINSTLLVFVSEMGDKTQLLALMLACCFPGRGWAIMGGIFVATLLNHALASGLGNWLALVIPAQVMTWILAATFFGFAVWVLIPDKDGTGGLPLQKGAFLTTAITFFIAEMGDKTQLATVALGAKYSDFAMVTLGSTLGMMASNGLAVAFGPRLMKRLPMKWVRIAASLLFVAFGLGVLLGLHQNLN
ncbi:MAG: TMEM165/GDT1 family protein [Bdellovibrionaceae bacterium]|nr:TMEM165/GDT1 family protein [Pseudobdellovibrionaceae bacterium]MBX3034172.1 TMEM165/GDT1 family protein [Pseudobdellovibrionaceae bacterium]